MAWHSMAGCSADDYFATPVAAFTVLPRHCDGVEYLRQPATHRHRRPVLAEADANSLGK